MPVMPRNLALYPGGSLRSPEWVAIRERIRARAGDKCERCGVPNHARGARHPDTDEWVDYPHGDKAVFPSSSDLFGERQVKIIQIVCTVAHLDGELVDHTDGNLAFLCQRCHNRLDAKKRAEHRRQK